MGLWAEATGTGGDELCRPSTRLAELENAGRGSAPLGFFLARAQVVCQSGRLRLARAAEPAARPPVDQQPVALSQRSGPPARYPGSSGPADHLPAAVDDAQGCGDALPFTLAMPPAMASPFAGARDPSLPRARARLARSPGMSQNGGRQAAQLS